MHIGWLLHMGHVAVSTVTHVSIPSPHPTATHEANSAYTLTSLTISSSVDSLLLCTMPPSTALPHSQWLPVCQLQTGLALCVEPTLPQHSDFLMDSQDNGDARDTRCPADLDVTNLDFRDIISFVVSCFPEEVDSVPLFFGWIHLAREGVRGIPCSKASLG